MKKLLTTIFLFVAAASPSIADDKNVELLKQHMYSFPIGHSPDYMLQISNGVNEWEDYILVFGNANDLVACQQIGKVLPWFKKNRCVRVN